MKASLVAGDSLDILIPGGNYPASAGWTLKLRLVPRAQGANVVVVTAEADGDNYRVKPTGAITKSWVAGHYSWASWVEKGDDSHTVDKGQITVEPDPRHAPVGADTRSLAAKALASAEEALANFRATKGVKKRYRIGEREMEFADTAEILREIRFWQRRVDDEEVAAGRRSRRAGVIKARI